MKILVIDDDKDMRELLKIIIEEKTEHKVLIAKNGLEGIEILKKNPVDLVITDRKMPQMLGEEVVRYVKLNYPHIKVILMSSVVDDVVALAAKDAGADLVVQKGNLVNTVEKFLD